MNLLVKTLQANGVTYRIKNKNHGFDLYQTKTVNVKSDGVETGETKEVEVWVGFMPTLDKVAYRLFHCELERSDAETLGEVLTVVNGTCKLIKTAGWTKEDLS